MSRRLSLDDFLGLEVRDADGKKLGHVHELKAERRDNKLCVVALVVGKRAWRSRLGPNPVEQGDEIPWERVAGVGSSILLRRD